MKQFFSEDFDFRITNKKKYQVHAIVLAACTTPMQVHEIIQKSLTKLAPKLPNIQLTYNSIQVQANGLVNVYNVLEKATYQLNPEQSLNGQSGVLMIGTLGEMWVMPLDKFLKTYTHLDDTDFSINKELSNKLLYALSKSGPENFAAFSNGEQLAVKTAWGSILQTNSLGQNMHGKGDFIVCGAKQGKPDFTDVWVVNGAVFPETYNITSWKNGLEENSKSRDRIEYLRANLNSTENVVALHKLEEPTGDSYRAWLEFLDRLQREKKLGLTQYHMLKLKNPYKNVKHARRSGTTVAEVRAAQRQREKDKRQYDIH